MSYPHPTDEGIAITTAAHGRARDDPIKEAPPMAVLNPLEHLYAARQASRVFMKPIHLMARMGQGMLSAPLVPGLDDGSGWGTRAAFAALEMVETTTRHYGKPEFGITSTAVVTRTGDIISTPVHIETVWSHPFCNLLRFRREAVPGAQLEAQPKVLIVAPLSGHFASRLRNTVEAMLPEHDVFITDWIDACEVPLAAGRFDLDDYTQMLIDIFRFIAETGGERVSVLAVCQPGVPALVAASMMAEARDPARPASLVLIGSPIDAMRNPTPSNEFAASKSLEWFRQNTIVRVPWPNRGAMREVHPGFLQLYSLLLMNPRRHVEAYVDHFRHLAEGDEDRVLTHRRYYDDYLAVMDLPAEFYLQTISRVFQEHLLARGVYDYRGQRVTPAAITDIGLMTIEGEKDESTGLGQTQAAHELVTGLPDSLRRAEFVKGAGHCALFSGPQWCGRIQPMVRAFVAAHRRAI